MADPSELLRQYYNQRIASQEASNERRSKEYIKELESKALTDRARMSAEADKYRADREFAVSTLELKGKNDMEKLGSWVNILTQLNKYDEQNPLSQYATDDSKNYEGTDVPIRYYMKDGESTGEPIPLSLAIKENKRDMEIKETRQLLLDGAKSLNMFGKVVDSESSDKGRFTYKSGEYHVDGKPLSKIQRDINENPTVRMLDENPAPQRRASKFGASQKDLKSRTNTMTVSDLIARQRETGQKGQGENKGVSTNVGNTSGGFNAGSSPSQFLGKVSDFFKSDSNPDPRPVGRGAYFKPEGVESVKNFLNRDPIAPIPQSKRKK